MMRVVASSVRGPSHKQYGLPCQDSWLAVVGERASLAVVCDGMGSRPCAREGARAGTLAARDAWRAWVHAAAGTVEDLVRLVEHAWRVRLGRVAAEDAATTCLLYAEDGHGGAVGAQLGDGVIARHSQDGTVAVHPSHRGSFGATLALGAPHTISDWSCASVQPLAPGEVLLLATDGVSEDVIPDRLGDLATWVAVEFGPLQHPGRALARALHNWPVPHHQDDKTLLVMWKP